MSIFNSFEFMRDFRTNNMKKTTKIFLKKAVLCLFFFGLFVSPSYSSDNTPTPVTDELLRRLGLDRIFHRCSSVADGDTLTLEDIGAIRFVGVDTPEKNHPKLPVQFMSQEASNFTRKLCLGKKIRLEYDSYDQDKRGNYGRVLGYLYLEDGTFVQEELLKRGYAIAYTKYPLDEERKQYFLKIEQESQNKGIGLWDDNGLSEVKWLFKQNYPMIQFDYTGKNQWALRYWKYVLYPVQKKDLEASVTLLYSWIYELSSGDLNNQLMQSGYIINPDNTANKGKFLLFGMAHKKWGLLYENYVYPRVLPGGLDAKCEQLVEIINEKNKDTQIQVFAKYGFRQIHEKYPNPPPHIHFETDCPTLANAKSDSSVICWDKADQFIGQKMTVTGRVIRTFKNDKVCFLNFHNNFTKYMSLVIFANKFRHFSNNPEKYYLNKTVLVTGKIKEYKGKPEIILGKPTQIEVID